MRHIKKPNTGSSVVCSNCRLRWPMNSICAPPFLSFRPPRLAPLSMGKDLKLEMDLATRQKTHSRDTPKALNPTAQGRRAAAHPG